MKKLLISAAALGLLAGAVQAQEVTIRIGTEGAYPPFNFIDDAGEVAGFERELGDRICEIAELKCSWVTTDWDSIIPNLVSGNFDMLMAGMTITAEREEVIGFSEAYLPPAPSLYIGLAGTDPDLENGVVAAQVNTIQASYVAESGATLVEFTNADETIAALRNGEADAVLFDADYLLPVVEESGGEIVVIGEPISIGEGIAVGLRKRDSDLKTKVDAAIDSMKEDGSLNEMITKWFGEDAPVWE